MVHLKLIIDFIKWLLSLEHLYWNKSDRNINMFYWDEKSNFYSEMQFSDHDLWEDITFDR